MAINILDSIIINRISAGEVVESPFSIVKELLDNSLDAGATKIHIEIKNGGIDYIQVKDNGKGIDRDDIIKAFLPHATSKIKNIEDLEEIATLGFRGEALASISNVSQTRMNTRTINNDCAFSIDVNGGVFGEIEPSSADFGTKIEVNNLFFNTPARRKFLKKPKQEEAQITNIISRYILAHPDISFKYIVDDKTIYQTSGNTLKDAIYCVYGAEFTLNLLPIEKQLGNIHLHGYASKVGFSKPNTTYQTLMVNGRYVIDEIVSKASYMAYEEYLMTRQFPVYILNLDMPNIDVDVNVHPSKLNVKFANPNKIYDLVFSAIRSAIYEQLNPIEVKETILPNEPKETLIKTNINSLKEIELEPNTKSIFDSKVELRQETFSPVTIFDLKHEEVKDNPNKKIETNNITSVKIQEDTNDYRNVEDFTDYKIVGQLFNEFLILERGEQMLLVDFHAGHERLNYDKFAQMVEARNIVVQDLLVPYVQSMTVQEVQFIIELKDKLFDLGFDIAEFGDNKIVINSVPMQLKDINLKNFVDDLLHDMKNFKPTMNNEIKHYLMQKACKSSVKSGMTLTELEIKELLKNLDKNNNVLLCPHGRPVVSVISRAQIEKWFKRIV